VDLKPGMFLYDVDEKSICILLRRFWSYEDHGVPSYAAVNPEFFKVWVWEMVTSKDGRVLYSQDGLINLIKAEIFIILDDS
jgi:hypothetical protein